MSQTRRNKPAEPVVNDDHALDNIGSGAKETVSVVEELEKNAEDWVNRLPESLQDEP